MSGRGHKAVLPPAGFRTEPPLAKDGLRVSVKNKAGHRKVFDFAELPVPEPMQRSLAPLFAAQSARWTSHKGAGTYWDRLLVFARFISELENPPRDLDELTDAMLGEWRKRHIDSNNGRATLGAVRVLLLREPRLGEGPVAEELARRIPKAKPSKQSFGDAEREQVLLAAHRQFRSAWMRIRENTELLERWQAGGLPEGSREWRIGEILDHIARTGDAPRTSLPSDQSPVTNARLLGGGSVEQTWGRLFLTRQELTALAVLMTDRFAWNLSVYDRMPTPTTSPSAGETGKVTYQVQVEKRRSGGGHWFDTENITDSGADTPGRLITLALEATAHGRRLAARLSPGHDLLMTARSSRTSRPSQDMDRPRPIDPLIFGVSDGDTKYWAKVHGLGGSPFQRGRRTVVIEQGKPLRHAEGTRESVYVLPDRHVQSDSRAVFEAGAHEAWEQAQAVVFEGHLAKKPDPAHQETAAADCEDETTSPWPAPGGGCGADLLLCLACTNAHVHPGHHPRLAHLRQQVESLRSALPEHVWRQRWRAHLLRLENLRGRVGEGAWAAALARVSDADRTLVRLLLKGDLTL